MKRLLLFICTLLCANVLMAQTRFWIGDLQYEVASINPAKVEVHDANSSITIANIPATVSYEGTTYSVTSIGYNAFYNCSSLTSVTIPNSVTSIGDNAFYNCSSLTSITIPNSVTSVGGAVFYGCYNLTSVTLSNNITSLPSYYNSGYYYGFFEECSSLTSVTIPNSVTTIGDLAFYDCESLTSVVIPNSVTSIGNRAFSSCSSLTSVTIPNSVTSIGNSTFSGCSSLTSVTIPNSVTSIDGGVFAYCSSLTSITIPNSVTSIGEGAFWACSSLTSVTIGESVDSIGNSAFEGCSLLQNVTCLATTPPTLADNTVFPYPNTATLTVPCGSLEAYSAQTSIWGILFADRIEEDCDDTGLEDVEETQLSFYPNPTNSKITFSSRIEKIEVIDLMGRCVLRFANASEINIETLPSGAYYLRLTNQDKAIIRKVIKE